MERARASARRTLSTGALLVLVGGCGGSTPSGAATSAEAGAEPRPVAGAEGLEPPEPEPVAREVRAYRAPEESAAIWLDLEALRTLDGWPALREELRQLLAQSSELGSLAADPATDPLERASLFVLSLGEMFHVRVVTLRLNDPTEARALAERVAGTGWVPVAGAEMAGLSSADDAPTIAVDQDDRLVVATAGSMRPALRAGPRTLEAFWDPRTVVASFARLPELRQHLIRAWGARSDGGVRVVARLSAPDAGGAEDVAAQLVARRDSLLGSPVVRVMGLEEALGRMRIRAAGSEVHADTTVSEAEATRLLELGVAAARAGLARIRALVEQHRR